MARGPSPLLFELLFLTVKFTPRSSLDLDSDSAFNANPQSQNQSQNSVAPALCRPTSPQNLISTASSCCVIIIAPSSYEQSPRSVMHLPPPPCAIALKDKALRVQACLAHDPVSLWELRELALSKGGLVNANLRRIAWPLLVGLPSTTSRITTPPKRHKPGHPTKLSDKDRDLVRRDASRSVLGKYSMQKDDTSQDLRHVLESVLEKPTRYGTLQYYQGLHDIAGVLLYNLKDKVVATLVLQRLCQSHFREALRDDNFVSLLSFLQTVVLPLLHKFDPELHDFVAAEDVMLLTIILPWMITWCLHDLTDPLVASRLVDAFLCGHSTFVLYVVVALIARYREEILNCMLEDDDPMMIVMTLKGLSSKIVSDYSDDKGDEAGISAQELIDDALVFMHQAPPRSLQQLAAQYHGSIPPGKSFFWKAPSSWALSSYPDHAATVFHPNKTANTDQAKLASGVTHLIRSVECHRCNQVVVAPCNAPSWFIIRSWAIWRKVIMPGS